MKKELTQEEAYFLHELVLQYSDVLTKYAYRFYSYQPHMLQTAQDAVQDTFLKAVQDVQMLMTHPNIAAWLKVSLKYSLLNIQRDPHWKFEELHSSVADSPTRRLHTVLDAFDRLELYPRLNEVVAVVDAILTEGESSTFYNYFLVGLSVEETAILEGVTTGSVRGRINRIRNKMKKHFGSACYLFFLLFYR